MFREWQIDKENSVDAHIYRPPHILPPTNRPQQNDALKWLQAAVIT